jgi:hypothetical protein
MADQPNRFVWGPGEVTISQCVRCVHKHAGAGTCAAFPDGIPDAILTNAHDHREPYAGDHGITFEPVEAA